MIHRLLICFVFALFSGAAATQSFPAKPIRLVVPFPPGGAVDILGRLFGEAVSRQVGQPVIVENKPGAGAAIGAEFVAKSAPYGYTLLIGTSSTHGLNSAVNPKLPYHPVNDFSPIVLLSTTPWLVVANPSLPVKSFQDLLAHARANPGKLNFASYGRGSSNHLATELLKSMAGIDVVHVPYKGSAPALVDLIAGHVHFMLDTYSTSKPHIEAGKARLLAVTTAKPVDFLPGTPSVAESGLPGYETGAFFAIWAPAKTPGEAVSRLNREFNAALRDAAVRERLNTMGMEPAGGSPEVLGQRVVHEVRLWADLVKKQNMKFD